MKFKRKVYETREEKTRDLLIGFFGWFVVNVLIWLLVAVVMQGGDVTDLLNTNYGMENLCVLPLNVIVLIVMGFRRRWMALGILVAVALNLALALILGMGEYGACGVPFLLGLGD